YTVSLPPLLLPTRPPNAPDKLKGAPPRYPHTGTRRPPPATPLPATSFTTPTAPGPAPGRPRRHRRTLTRLTPRPPTRRERITAIITSQPPRDWSGHELAQLLGVKPRNMLTQLGEWAKLRFFTRTGYRTYALHTPPPTPPTTAPAP